jgi:hypothetical protein
MAVGVRLTGKAKPGKAYPKISQITQIKRYVKEKGNLRAGLGFSPHVF